MKKCRDVHIAEERCVFIITARLVQAFVLLSPKLVISHATVELYHVLF